MNRIYLPPLLYLSLIFIHSFSIYAAERVGNVKIESSHVKNQKSQGNTTQPSQKTLEDGRVLVRHAGDEWSREKIREYLSHNKLILNFLITRPVGRLKDLCQRSQLDLQNLNFEFIQPDLVTDDWEAPVLDVYKKKFKKFKYAMGADERYGLEYAKFPTWNINIYDVDTDGDGDIEAILYGEKLSTQYGEKGFGDSHSGYLIFENKGKRPRGGHINGDPSSFVLDADDYALSGLIKIQKLYAALIVYDWRQEKREYQRREYNVDISHSFSVVLYLLSIQNKYKSAFNFAKCLYFLKNIQNPQLKR